MSFVSELRAVQEFCVSGELTEATRIIERRMGYARGLASAAVTAIEGLEQELFTASWQRMVLLAGLQQFSVHTSCTKDEQQPWRQWLFNAVLAHDDYFQKEHG